MAWALGPNEQERRKRAAELERVNARIEGIYRELDPLSIEHPDYTELIQERNRLLIRQRQLEYPVEKEEKLSTCRILSGQ